MSDADDELLLWKRRAKHWKRLALLDSLTGLPNRRAWDNAARRIEPSEQGGLILLDLDGLKELNDREGHALGDDLLRRTAEVLWTVLPEDGIAFRIGGDEFAILVSEDDPAEVAQRLTTDLAAVGIQSTSGWGYAVDQDDMPALFQAADRMLVAAKAS